MLRMILILLGLFVAIGQCRRADFNCSTSGYIETCNIYLDPKNISVVAKSAATPQQQANWCWLASIEMAFRYYGYAVPQEKLLGLLWGNIEDMPGRAEQIIGATNRVYTDDAGKRFRAESSEASSWFDASFALSANVPVLVGYAQPGGIGHMTMVIGMQYQWFYNSANQIIGSRVSEVVLWDPWPGVGVRNMSQSEFDNAFLLVGVTATPLDPTVSVLKRPQAVKPLFRFRYDLMGRRLK